MRILLANNHLTDFHGSEIFTYTLNAELMKRHYEIDVFTLWPGLASKRIPNIISIDEIKKRPENYYDAAFVNHNTCLRVVKRLKVSRRIVCTMHGIYPWQEQPRPGADVYVAISEEVQSHANALGYQSLIIRNGIDVERFKPQRKADFGVKTVMLLSNYLGAEELVKQACAIAGMRFVFTGSRTKEGRVWDVENRIAEVDLVVTIGRGVLESLSCGKNVVVYDNRLYVEKGFGDGLFTSDIGLEMAKNNYSGRRFKKEFSAEELAAELSKFDAGMARDNREFVLRNHDIRKQADKYLELCD